MDDELTHFLFARAGIHSLSVLLSVWGRPGFTVPFALVAGGGDMAGGFLATRLLTVAVITTAGWLAWRMAKVMRSPFPWLVPWLLLITPMWMSLSYTPTTEAAAALYTIAGTYQLARGNRRWAAVWFAMLPVTRHEMIVLLVPIALFFVIRRDLIAALLLGWAEGLWNLLSKADGLDWPIHRFFEKQPVGNYGTGDIVHYIVKWVELASVGGVVMILIGCGVILWRNAGRIRQLLDESRLARRARMEWFIAAGSVALVVLNTLLYEFNTHASGGYARFLLPAVPWMAIAVLFAVHAFTRWIPHPTGAILCGLIAVSTLIQTVQTVHPYRMTDQQKLVGNTVRFLRDRYPDARIVGASPWLDYFANGNLRGFNLGGQYQWEHNDPPGVFYFYDMSHAINAVPYEKLTQYHHEFIGPFYAPGDTDIPYLRIIRRLP